MTNRTYLRLTQDQNPRVIFHFQLTQTSILYSGSYSWTKNVKHWPYYCNPEIKLFLCLFVNLSDCLSVSVRFLNLRRIWVEQSKIWHLVIRTIITLAYCSGNFGYKSVLVVQIAQFTEQFHSSAMERSKERNIFVNHRTT